MTDKNSRKRSGLHKEISSIFDGVPVPKDRTAARPHAGPDQGPAGYDSPRPPANVPQNPQIPGSHQRPKPPAGEYARTGEAPDAEAKGPLQQAVKKFLAPKPGVSPTRQKVMMLLVPLLLVVFIIILAKNIDIPLAKTKKITVPTAAQPTTPVAPAVTEITWQRPDPYPPELRDPMQLTAEMVAQMEAAIAARNQQNQANTATTNTSGPTADVLTVKGILFSDDKPAAVIGTEIAHAGDIIAGARIVKINKDSVEFEKDGETWTQPVQP